MQKSNGITLQRRLILLFIFAMVSVILAFALLLFVSGINGKHHSKVYDYFNNELTDLSEDFETDLGKLSLLGISLSEDLSKSCENFLEEKGLSLSQLQEAPEFIEPLLEEQMPTLLTLINHHTCGGVYLLLDATINPNGEQAQYKKAGIFIKKTFPTTTHLVGMEYHWLRGPANIARNYKIGIIGQWMMEYDISEEPFFIDVMETARQNPTLSLSRLYYWTGRTVLKGNSEAGFLLCVPLRGSDGTVFGVCGIEVSDRMFKLNYAPTRSNYPSAFCIATPCCGTSFDANLGLIAGNHYLSGKHMNQPFTMQKNNGEFEVFTSTEGTFGGLSTNIRLYPFDSAYKEQNWRIAVLMPKNELDIAVRGNSGYFWMFIMILSIASLFVSFVMSHRYTSSITTAFDSIKNSTYTEVVEQKQYVEIYDLFAYLAQKDKEHEEEVQTLENNFAKAQTELSYLAEQKKQEVPVDNYQLFLESLCTLTPKETLIFNLYLEGKSSKEILEIANITENTLKYHNKNLYSKLGVQSRKELLRYATIMKQEQKRQN